MNNNYKPPFLLLIIDNWIRIGIIIPFLTLVFILTGYTTTTAQIVYTDVVPDYEILKNSNYDIDINNDGVIDVTINHIYTSQNGIAADIISVLPQAGSQVAVSNESASVFFRDDIIDASLNWCSDNKILMLHDDEWNQWGDWIGVNAGFLGVKIKQDQAYYYAWVRIHNHHFINYPSYYECVLDYAYNSISDLSIQVGAGLPMGATSVSAQDVANFFDGRDIQFIFNKAWNEDDLLEYRLVLTKATDTSAYDIGVMNQLDESQYTSVMIDTSNPLGYIKSTFSEATFDKDGDSLLPMMNYRIHLLNVANSGNPEDNTLSVPSPVFYLQAICNAAQKPVAFDGANSHNASDIGVYFGNAEEEQFIKEYRIYVAPAYNTNPFTIETVLSLSNSYYTPVLPQGSTINTAVNANQLDVTGNLFTEDEFYRVYVLSLADSNYSIVSAISQPSRKFIIADPNFFYAGQKTGSNVKFFACDSLFSSGDSWTRYDSDTVEIDMNRDGISDFKLTSYYVESVTSAHYEYNILPYRNNAVLVCDHPEHNNWVDVLMQFETISAGYEISHSISLFSKFDYSSMSNYYYWAGHSNLFYSGYIGFVMRDNNTPQYAWLKMQGGYFIEYAFQDVNSGIDQHSTKNKFQIFPNPASEFIQIQRSASSALNEVYSVSMVNSQGIVLDEFGFTGKVMQKNIETYPSGIYLVVFHQKGKVIETQRLIVQ